MKPETHTLSQSSSAHATGSLRRSDERRRLPVAWADDDWDNVCVIIIIRPCDWKSAPFGRLNALPTDAKPVTKWTDADDAFLDITEGIKRIQPTERRRLPVAWAD